MELERIFSGEVYDVVPQSGGIVFSYCKETRDEDVLVAYKMLSLENGTLTDVARNIYLLSKFGSNYRAVVPHLKNHITAKSLILPSGGVFACSEDGEIVLLDADGTVAWTGELKYRGFVPSDIAFHKNSLWTCYKEVGVLLRYNLTTLREELRIGGKKTPFDKPNDMFIEGDIAYVSNIGSNKILKVNLVSYTVEEFKEFSEPVYSYCSVKDKGFAMLKSGIYTV